MTMQPYQQQFQQPQNPFHVFHITLDLLHLDTTISILPQMLGVKMTLA